MLHTFHRQLLFSQYFNPLGAMSALKKGRYLVMAAVTIMFLYSIGKSLDKFAAKQIGETQGTKRAAEMFFPSLAINPLYDLNYALSRVKGTKNLKEDYDDRQTIADKILMMQQSYESENG